MRKLLWVLLGLAVPFFLASCGGGGTSGEANSGGQDTAASDSGVTSHWKLGVQMWTFRKFTFAQALDKVDSAGIKYIEAFWGQPLGAGMKDSFGIHMSEASKSQLKALLQQKDIQMVAMGVISPATREEWVKAFALAKEFGLSYITAEPRTDQWDMVDSLAGVNGIKVAIHDHPRPNRYWHPDSVLAAIQGHPNIGDCADLGHWARNGLDPVACLKELAGHVYGVHLKDITEFDNTQAADTVVGDGVIDFPPIFEELKREGFQGMISIEHESNWLHSLPDVIRTREFYEQQVATLK